MSKKLITIKGAESHVRVKKRWYIPQFIYNLVMSDVIETDIYVDDNSKYVIHNPTKK